MRTLRRRALAKAVGARYYVRSDGVICLRYPYLDWGMTEYPWYPEFPKDKFLKRIAQLDGR